jgi:peptidoglycan-N-acetylmuramic acid deacetylase
MTTITDPEAFRQELESLEALYKETTGQDMHHFYRPPSGKYDERSLKMAKDLGYKTVFWSLAYKDWLQDSQPSHELAFKKLLPRSHNGAIVLLHSTSKTNAEIMDKLLTQWESEGYHFGRLDELRF